jgi:hypothetical protein
MAENDVEHRRDDVAPRGANPKMDGLSEPMLDLIAETRAQYRAVYATGTPEMA